ncbi:hypothetical protein QE250_10995 [Chromatiaceae bacterium AAb-1]|jgi:hypothetical protein|nr:hypothetical protein [Chromatiaceae bacterium AAb-1]
MTAIDHWKILIRQANKAFSRKQLPLAAILYQQAVLLLLNNWPSVTIAEPDNAAENMSEDPATLLVICLSISIQNLAETYARQQRWRRCLSTLNRALLQLQQVQQQLPATHPASVALLREGCNLRRELCRFSKLRQDCSHKKAGQKASVIIPLASASIH